jgi:pyruvate/2-oxoglutarate dehydrogenase complex dihydrolipoamide dehydrogenase (E3) component
LGALGCTVDDLGFVAIDATGRTKIDGVSAAGDLTGMRHFMSIAVAQGTGAAADCVKALILGSA